MQLKSGDIDYLFRRINYMFGQKNSVINLPDNFYIVYGSFIEASIGLDREVKDIDVMIVDNGTRHATNEAYDITYVSLDDIIHEVHNEPKMLLVKSTLNIEPYFDRSKVRASVSNVCSKAYNKGKKKLIIADDYDENLGLKNLYHSMKFPYFAKWKFIDNNTYPQEDIDFLNEVQNKIFSTYKSSTGTLEERFQAVNSWLKPEFNKVMTEFRKNFPKEI